MRISRVATSPFVPLAGIFLVYAPLAAAPRTCILDELQKVTASDAAASHNFGSSVSINKDRAVVGAWRGVNKQGSVSGAAYVFRRDDNDTPLNPIDDFWVEEDKLIASDAAAGDLFGWSVSIHGNHAIVGARFHVSVGRSGAAYIFRHNGNDTPSNPRDDFWVQEDRLTPSDAATGDDFGNSVAISGDRAVVGAFDDDDACKSDPDPDCNSGSAYVFRRDDNATPFDPSDDFWVEEAKLTASDASPGDLFGMSVSIYGERAVVGAWHTDEGGTDAGSAYVFRHDDNGTPLNASDDTWIEEYKLTASDARRFDNFGVSVSISGDRVLVGSWLDDDGSLSGSAYVFRREDNGTFLDPTDDFWVEEAKLTASDAAAGDEFGKSVSLDGGRAAVGAFEDDDACADDPDPDPNCDSGSGYLFQRYDNDTPLDPSDDFWMEQSKLTASDTAFGTFFGRVAVSGDWVIGASLDDAAGDNAGAAYMFSFTQVCSDLVYFADFQTCASGEGGGVFLECEVFNVDGDEDVDLVDYVQLLRTFTGP